MKHPPPMVFYPFLSALLLLGGCGQARDRSAVPEEGRNEVATVQTAKIQPWEKGSVRRFPGVVHPIRRAVLGTRVNGTIHSVTVAAGDAVAAGTVLAQIESRDVEAVIEGAKAKLESAETAANQAERNLRRLRRLYAEDLIARNRLEQARVRHKAARAKVEAARAELKVQRLNRRYAQVTAPFDGRIRDVVMDQGSFIAAGKPILILEDRSTLQIDVPLPSRIADRITPQDGLSVQAPSMREPRQVKYGALVPVPGKASAGRVLQLFVENPPATMQPGQVVTVRLETAEDQKLVALPRAALIRRGQLRGVLVVQKRQDRAYVFLRWVHLRAQTPGQNEWIPVSQGLKAGELVVLDPSPELRDGQQVRLGRGAP